MRDFPLAACVIFFSINELAPHCVVAVRDREGTDRLQTSSDGELFNSRAAAAGSYSSTTDGYVLESDARRPEDALPKKYFSGSASASAADVDPARAVAAYEQVKKMQLLQEEADAMRRENRLKSASASSRAEAVCTPECVDGRGVCHDGLCWCKTPYSGPTCDSRVDVRMRVSRLVLAGILLFTTFVGVILGTIASSCVGGGSATIQNDVTTKKREFWTVAK
mmetsp:Transcript_13827/g.34079  ORF Transcript_13827/g.34079 Transcript_13827/m.34079 type:complete len:222 (+) Transcript_13827:213-878(+)|eukprot:g2481.t1